MNLAQQKQVFLVEIDNDAALWRMLMYPQFCLVFLMAFALTAVVVIGISSAAWHLREANSAESLATSLSVFIGGSSSLLGVRGPPTPFKTVRSGELSLDHG